MGRGVSEKVKKNRFYQARNNAAKNNEGFNNREDASVALVIDAARLGRIENDEDTPRVDEVVRMAKVYNDPDLINYYCAKCCLIGRESVPEVIANDFDRIVLQILGACENIEYLRYKLTAIACDGNVEANETKDFSEVLKILKELSISSQAMLLWSKNNLNINTDGKK